MKQGQKKGNTSAEAPSSFRSSLADTNTEVPENTSGPVFNRNGRNYVHLSMLKEMASHKNHPMEAENSSECRMM